MKVKNIMFSGVMAAILTGVACSADAAGYQVASKQYVDARDEAIVAAQEAVDTQQNAAIEAATSATTGVTDRVGALETTVGDANSGLVADVNALGTDVDALETTVGNAESGLVKDVADLKTADTTMGGRVEALETDVGALETAVGDANSGLVKDVNTLETDVADLKTNKQNALTADSYIDADALAENKVKVVVDGQIAAGNTGIVTGATVYQYALPTPPEECSNTTCVLTTDQNGAPYWMQLWLPGDTEGTPENGSDA